MSNKFSLEKLRNNPDFAGMFAKKATVIKQNKNDLLEAAQEYQKKYSNQIEEGTRKRQLMLAEGEAKGMKEEEIFKDNQVFIPTKQTPILNYLYFLLYEHGDLAANIKVLRAANTMGTDFALLKEQFEEKYGAEVHKDHSIPEAIPNMVKFMYGNVNDDTMSTLKKLKTMAMSDNEKEAFVAFRKGRDLAQKCGLEWDQIPYNR